MTKGGLFFFFLGCLSMVGTSVPLYSQDRKLSPIPEPTEDAIAQAIEAERKRREIELNNPTTQVAIQYAQRIQSMLVDINLKSQEYRITIENILQAAQKSGTPEAEGNYYLQIISTGYAFRQYGVEKMTGILDDPDNLQRKQALALLDDLLIPVQEAFVKNRTALAEAAQQRHEYDEAKQLIDEALLVLPRNVALMEFRRSNEQLEAKFRKASPGTDVAARLQELEARKREVQVLLRDGKFLWEARDFDQAEKKFLRVTKMDPRNDVAYNYLRLISRVRNDDAELAREVNFRDMVQEVNEKWRPPAHQATLPVPNPEWMLRTRGSAGEPGGGGVGANTGVIQKLQTIQVPEVAPLDGFSLNEAVTLLHNIARVNDPSPVPNEQKGVNIMISTQLPKKNVTVNVGSVGNMGFVGSGLPAPNVNWETGIPIQKKMGDGSMSHGFDGGNTRQNGQSGNGGHVDGNHLDPTKIRIRGLTAPLYNLSLQQVLDNVADACDHPMRIVVRNGVVRFEHKPDDSEFVQRRFTIKPNMFWTKLSSQIHKPNNGISGFNQRDPFFKTVSDENSPLDSKTFNAIAPPGGGGGGVVNNTQAAQQILTYLQSQGINAAQVFFNPSNGQLLVRAPLADLDLIEQAIEILNSSPEQLYIEAKFAEIEFNDGDSLGFDWYLGKSTILGDKVIAGTGAHPTFIGKPTATNPSGFFPYPGTLNGNTFVPSQFSKQPSASEGHLTSAFKGYGNPLLTFTGIMTDPQFRMVLNTISAQEGAELLSAPRVLAISGQPTSIAVQDERQIAVGVQPTFIPGQGIGGAGGGIMAPVNAAVTLGPTLDVVPYVNADGYTIEMSVTPSITEFLGYEDSPVEAAVFSAGTVIRQAQPQPRIRNRTLTANCVVWDQTVLALGGLISETVTTTSDKVPFLGDAPFIGRLFRGKGRNSKKKNMVIYVKPTIIDPAGQPKNRPGQLPFARTNSPDPMGLINPVDPSLINNDGNGGGDGLNKFQNRR